jgi:hypothetical protein
MSSHDAFILLDKPTILTREGINFIAASLLGQPAGFSLEIDAKLFLLATPFYALEHP